MPSRPYAVHIVRPEVTDFGVLQRRMPSLSARLLVSTELGHCREQVVGAYRKPNLMPVADWGSPLEAKTCPVVSRAIPTGTYRQYLSISISW